ncbi:hypothetical protein OIV83_002722 [Microbotryomycetes sp. JL201]|nr:hypothetical protein OIV83_002722 [Microbotryomycetes sp. JL201]
MAAHPQERAERPVEPDLFEQTLPPSANTEEAVYETPPSVLADRLLHPHNQSLRPSDGQRRSASHSPRPSLLQVLTDDGTRSEHHTTHSALARDESESLLNGQDTESELSDDDLARPSRSSSRSRHRKRDRLPWHKRPSPIWFIPGTLIMTLSMSATSSPKLEIYYQLVCKAIGPQQTMPARDPVVVPPPVDPGRSRLPPSMTATLYHSSSRDVDVVQAFIAKSLSTPEDIDLPQPHQPSELPIPAPPARSSRWKLVIDDSGDDESWMKQCHKSATVSKANTLLTFVMGCLSALTTGWWGSLSDRHGRKPVLGAALLGLNLMDIVFLVTVAFHDVVGYRFLFMGPILDGLLGGFATAQATGNAYLSDCTEAGSRARIFSVLGGMMFLGIAAGPLLGAYLIKASGNVLAPFYAALVMHLLYLIVALAFVPESLTKERQYEARERHRVELEKRKEQDKEEDAAARERGPAAVIFTKGRRLAVRPWSFLKPLKMLLPRKRALDESEEDRPVIDAMGKPAQGWDFSLVKIGIAAGCYGLAMAMIAFKLLYASNVFDWGYEQNGKYLSFLGVCRVIVLIVLLPTFIKLLRKPPPKPSRPRPEHDTAGDPNELSDEQKAWDKEETWLRVVHDSRFDLFLARISMAIDMIAYAMLALNGGSPARFLAATAFSCLGGGAMPAIQSLALAHASPRDAGRLFASLSVLSSVMSSIIGPLLFGSIFISTVGTAPETIFWVGAGVFVVSFCSMLLVRLRKARADEEDIREDELPSRETARQTKHKDSAFTLRTIDDDE